MATRNGTKTADLANLAEIAIVDEVKDVEEKSRTQQLQDVAKQQADLEDRMRAFGDALAKEDLDSISGVNADTRFVSSVGIQYLSFDDLKRIVEYRGDKVYLMKQTGSTRILLGRMTVDGIERDTNVRLTSTIQKFIDGANRKWSYAAKEKAELSKTEKLNKARLELDELFA